MDYLEKPIIQVKGKYTYFRANYFVFYMYISFIYTHISFILFNKLFYYSLHAANYFHI